MLEKLFKTAPAFRRFKVEVVTAGNGEEGLQAFDTWKPELVICDLLMPRMDGFQFCAAVRQRASGADTPILVMSGVYRDVNVSVRVREEFHAVLFAKPYQLKDLTEAVEKHLSGGRVVTGIPAPPPPGDVPAVGPMDGSFAQIQLSALLLELFERQATGVLELRRARVEKRIELVEGQPISVSSNQRQELLGHFLVAKKIVTEDQLQQALERARDKSGKLGETLVEAGVLTFVELNQHLIAQARFKIVAALRWSTGAWSFRPNQALFELARGESLDPPSLVFDGLNDTAHINDAASFLSKLGGRELALSPRGERFLGAFTKAFGLDIDLAQGVTVEGVLKTRPEPTVVLPALEALVLTGCLVPRAVPTAKGAPLPEAPTAKGAALPEADPLSLDTLRRSVTTDHGVPLPRHDAEIIVNTAPEPKRNDETARETLLAEFLRVQGKDWHAVLRVDAHADEAAVKDAFAQRMAEFTALEQADLEGDAQKLVELGEVYRRARDALLGGRQVVQHERDPQAAKAPLTAEIQFREGEKLLAEGAFEDAIAHFREATAAMPQMADYHAALGWALHLATQANPSLDPYLGNEHLANALSIDPDHGAAHEYMGKVLLSMGNDNVQAASHLERALDADPPRMGALAPLEDVRTRTNEFGLLERQFRKLLYRLKDKDDGVALLLWLKLGQVYHLHLNDLESARVSYQCASRLSPDDPTILSALEELTAGDTKRFKDRAEALRAHWRIDPTDREPGLELVRWALDCSNNDAAYLAASILVARGIANDTAMSLYKRFRPRVLAHSERELDEELTALLNHPGDDQALRDLYSTLAPLCQLLLPLGLADVGVAEADRVADAVLSKPFSAVRAYVADTLKISPPPVFCRGNLGDRIVTAVFTEPVLLAGTGAINEEDRLVLAFRLGRALTYALPGRGSTCFRPSRLSKALLVAALSFVSPGTPVHDPDGLVQKALAWLQGAAPSVQADVRHALHRITSAKSSVNLSNWSRAIGRTADRIGLVLCGDVCIASRILEAEDDEALDDLLDFAISGDHFIARSKMGLVVRG